MPLEIKVSDNDRDRVYTSAAVAEVIPQILRLYLPQIGPIVEVGCGNGLIAQFMPPAWKSLLAAQIDMDEKLLGQARRMYPKDTYMASDVYDLPFPDSSLPAILVVNLFDILSDLPAGLRELRRVLKPGGTLLHLQDFFPSPQLLYELLPQEHGAFPFHGGGEVKFCVVNEREFNVVCEMCNIGRYEKSSVQAFFLDPQAAYRQLLEEFPDLLDAFGDLVRRLPQIVKLQEVRLSDTIAQHIAHQVNDAHFKVLADTLEIGKCITHKNQYHLELARERRIEFNSLVNNRGMMGIAQLPAIPDGYVQEEVQIHCLQAVNP